MITGYIERENSYSIPYRAEIKGDEKQILLVAHGFASSKESPNVNMLMEELPKEGIGVFAFDFPAHGDSPAGGEGLTTDNCMDDMKAAADYIGKVCPDAELCYFGSSFGAYIIMLYLMKYKVKNSRAFMRSAAVDMNEFFEDLSMSQQQEMEKTGYIVLKYDFVPDIMLTEEFLEDLKAHDLMELFSAEDNEFRMIHGSRDEDVDYQRAKTFAENFGIELVTVEGGDHRLSIPGAPEKVLRETLDFLR